MLYSRAGLTLTQTWNTANALDSKVEVKDALAKGLKAEALFSFLPASQAKGAKFNLHFQQNNFHGRAFFDLLKGPTANVDAVVGDKGFLAGASAGYDVNKAAITSYAAAVGYTCPSYNMAVTATDNISVFGASFYQKVNSQVEGGCKAVWNSKTGSNVGIEFAGKYRIDPVSFAKVCIHTQKQNRTKNPKKEIPPYSPAPPRVANPASPYRSSSTTAASLPLPTTSFSARALLSASAPRSTPRSSTRPPTRLAPASLSSLKRLIKLGCRPGTRQSKASWVRMLG